MPTVKLLEIRDRATFIPVYAISTKNGNKEQNYLFRRSGYTPDNDLIIISRLEKGTSTYDPYDWNDRTMKTAHAYIEAHFPELLDGDVIDVEFILKESDKPKLSERLTVIE